LQRRERTRSRRTGRRPVALHLEPSHVGLATNQRQEYRIGAAHYHVEKLPKQKCLLRCISYGTSSPALDPSRSNARLKSPAELADPVKATRLAQSNVDFLRTTPLFNVMVATCADQLKNAAARPRSTVAFVFTPSGKRLRGLVS